ncbi:winged helix DNA-binding domain-containing protein [Streptomyces sp. NPDC097619]|uniref:winged helix DNA-binding domain-containing protein n=1 Tax=Streptomyces sp. NPDC097619 TaxID=3157228 RepID=UPI00333297E7
MSSLPRISTADRRDRLGTRHRLAPSARAGSAAEAADSVLALHATDAATVFLSVRARTGGLPVPAIEEEFYERVAVVRLLSMRNTLFAVSVDRAPLVDSSTARAIAAKERRTLLKHLAEDGQGLDADWLAGAEGSVLDALASLGPTSGNRLSAAVPVLRQKITVSPGGKWETVQGVATRVLRVLAAEGRIRRDRPHGTWTSSQFRWTPHAPWPELPAATARTELARLWLDAYGPATEADLKWWTGWTLTQARAALAGIGAEPVLLDDGGTALVSPGDTGPVAAPEPWAAFLPGLDPSAMGWADRSFHLDPAHRPPLFDRAGNIGPTVWWNGEIIGGWAQRPDGEIVWRLLADRGEEAATAVAEEAARLRGWMDGARVTPRFRTPLERELTG